MTTEELSHPVSNGWRRYLPWLNLILIVVLISAGFWYLSSRIGLAAIAETIAAGEMGYVLLAAAIMVLTIVIKGFRWQLMFTASPTPIRCRTDPNIGRQPELISSSSAFKSNAAFKNAL